LFWMRSMVCATEMITPMVWPSGAARLRSFIPSAPEAPAWFSTTTGWCRLSLNFWPISRALMSPAPPGGLGTMMRIGREGKSCAEAARGSRTETSSNSRGQCLNMPRSLLLSSPRTRGPIFQSRWLWVPAFAGTTARRLLQRPFAVAQARQQALLVQRVELECDLAAVAAAERLHDLREKQRPGRQRLAHGLRPRLAVVARRARAASLDR